jgi:alpha-acetolactate decarboxylase
MTVPKASCSFCPAPFRLGLLAVALLACGCVTRPVFDRITQVGWPGAGTGLPFPETPTVGWLVQHGGESGIARIAPDGATAVLLGGRAWIGDEAGAARLLPPWTRVEFACVSDFRPDLVLDLQAGAGCAAVARLIGEAVPDTNVLCAVRVQGRFHSVRLDAPAAAGSATGALRHVSGWILGFRFPEHSPAAIPSGLHFWLLTVDRLACGPVAEFSVREGSLAVDVCDRYEVLLPAARRATRRLVQ